MANYVLFSIYTLIVLGLFGFIAIFMMHIRDYQHYSKYVGILTKVYLILMFLIACFGGYYTLMGDIFPHSKAPVKRINL